MADNNYWKERFLKDKARSINISEKYIKGRLKTYYTEAAKEIETDIESFYEKYAKDEKITLAEARKRISEANLDRSRFEKMAKENAALKKKYGKDIPEGIAKQIAEQERILNTLSKKGAITRLENLKAGIDNAILKLYDKQQITMYDILKDGYEEGYYRGMFRIQHGIGIGSDFTRVNERAVRQAVLTNHGKGNFSSRLYKHSKTLSKDIQENLTVGLIRGESVDKMARRISKRLDVSMSNAKRLVRTETAYIHELATLESYKEAGITTYRFVATLDNRTSEICQELDRKEFSVEKATPGENFPPMHPNCRSTTEAVFEDEIESTRTARASDGSQYMVPRDMTYEQWREEYVGDSVFGETKKLYTKYREILGDMSPSIDEFVKIRYNVDEWKQFKAYTSSIKTGELTPLADFELYKNISKQMDELLVGVLSISYVKITGKSNHSIARVIGSVEQRRNGVSVRDVLDALTNKDSEILPIKVLENGKSQKFRNSVVEVSVNPDTGIIIQVNPVHSRKGVK